MYNTHRIKLCIEAAIERGKDKLAKSQAPAPATVIKDHVTVTTHTPTKHFDEVAYRKAVLNCFHKHMNKKKEMNNE